MRSHRARFLSLGTAACVAAALAAGCSSSGSSSSSSSTPKTSTKAPLVIGASLSLSGDFSADGVNFERGYKLWANQS